MSLNSDRVCNVTCSLVKIVIHSVSTDVSVENPVTFASEKFNWKDLFFTVTR